MKQAKDRRYKTKKAAEKALQIILKVHGMLQVRIEELGMGGGNPPAYKIYDERGRSYRINGLFEHPVPLPTRHTNPSLFHNLHCKGRL